MNTPHRDIPPAPLMIPRLPHLAYGGDYNPDQWPEDIWREDARLMREAGVNLVTLGVFSWARMEPQRGVYDFAWLDTLFDLLHESGVRVNLATPTAAPPAWLERAHPESLPVTREGTRLGIGSRESFCPNSGAYREAVAAVVRELAGRYAGHPALAMWHISNEYACHVPACYCDSCAAAFQGWLRRRYQGLDALNAAWGTAFWSQRYGEWEEITPPRAAPAQVNPTQQLDYARFMSDSYLACFELEKALLRAATPDIPITTNFMGFFKPLDYWAWAAREDVVSHDSYPDPALGESPIKAAMSYDLMRGLARGNPWLLMEQTPSQVNWRSVNALKRPGQMRLWSYQAVARGANGSMFFQWRASKAGSEKFHGGVVPHVGTERSRVWDEARALGNELAGLDALLPAQTRADVAILFDWESWWALELDSHPSSEVSLWERTLAYYTALWRRNITADFVPASATADELARYRVVVVPNLYLTRDATVRSLTRYVERGGTLVMGYFSGIVDEHDHIRMGGYPAPFRALLGLRVEEFAPVPAGAGVSLRVADGATYSCDQWADVMDLEGAEALATFDGEWYAGRPAVTRHRFMDGVAYYVGTRPEPAYLDLLLRQVCDEAGVAPEVEAPEGVEVTRRVAGGRSYLFALNHASHAATLALTRPGRDLLTGERREITLDLAPLGVAIVAEDEAR